MTQLELMRRLTRSCLHKKRHATRISAEREILFIRRQPDARNPERLMVYACTACEGWHVGHG